MPSPSLLVGVGEQGRKVGEAFARELEALTPRFVSLAGVLHEPSEESCLRTVEQLLRLAGKDTDQGNSAVTTWIVGDLAEPSQPGTLLERADRIKRCVQAGLLGLSLHVEALLFVPRGTSEAGQAIAGFLRDVSRKDGPLDFSWIVSSGAHALNSEERVAVAVRFLLLSFLSDLPLRMWAHEQLQTLTTRLGTFGLSGVVVPVRDLRQKEAARLSAEILEEIRRPGLVSAETRDLEDFFQRHRLSVEEVKAECLEGAKIAFSDREKKISLETVYPAGWPDRLWGVYYFFAFGGLSANFERIRQNREKKWQQMATDLAATVNAVVERNVRPSSALSFLEQVDARASALQGDRTAPAAGKEFLQDAIDALSGAYRDLPAGLGAVLLRAAFLAFILAYVAHLVVPRLLVLPALPAPAYFLLGLGLAAILTGGISLLSYGSKMNRFSGAKGRAEGAVWQALESALDSRAHNEALSALDRLQCASASPEARARRGLSSEPVASEYDAVLRYGGQLEKAMEQVRLVAEQEHPDVPVLRNLDAPISYRSGRYSIAEEARTCVENGLHRGWREAGVEDVVERLLDLAIAGLPAVPDVEELLVDMRDGEVTRLGRWLLETAAPLVPLAPTRDGARVESRYLFAKDGEKSRLVPRLELQHLSVLSAEDPHGVFLLRTFLGIAPEEIMAFEPWQRGVADA